MCNELGTELRDEFMAIEWVALGRRLQCGLGGSNLVENRSVSAKGDRKKWHRNETNNVSFTVLMRLHHTTRST